MSLNSPSSETKEDKLQRYRNDLHVLRHGFVEEFSTAKHSAQNDDPNYHLHKTRTNYFGYPICITNLIKQLWFNFSEETENEIKHYEEFIETIRWTTRFYKQDDINIANKFLDTIISELDNNGIKALDIENYTKQKILSLTHQI